LAHRDKFGRPTFGRKKVQRDETDEAVKIKIFNYGTHSARDYWNLITRPDLDDFRKLVSPRTTAHVTQSLWNLWEWICVEDGRILTNQNLTN
jgi:hypothetical protein